MSKERIPRGLRNIAANCGGELLAFTSGILFTSGHQPEWLVPGIAAGAIGLANVVWRYRIAENSFTELPAFQPLGIRAFDVVGAVIDRLDTDSKRPEAHAITELLLEVNSKTFAFYAGEFLLDKPEGALILSFVPLMFSILNIWRFRRGGPY